MSRSGYGDDCEGWEMIRWRGAVNAAIKGKRGQQLLKELAAGMDAMNEKVLIADELEVDGAYCALGVVGSNRGIDLSKVDPEDSFNVAKEFNIANALALEIVYMNDEGSFGGQETPEKRWERMRKWVDENIIKETHDR